MNKNIIIATTKKWNINNFYELSNRFKDKFKFYLMTDKKELNYRRVAKISPLYIFFPHWSWYIPETIFNNYECIVFHMTDLPYGRGGSPLQNLILRGFKKTKITAIKVVKELDAGPIYLKKTLSLSGSAQNIYERCSKIIFNKMIPKILQNKIIPIEQKGKVVIFKRRKPEDSEIPYKINIFKFYDFVRMLDAETYPKAFIKRGNLIFYFSKIRKLRNRTLKSEVLIREI